MAIRLAWPRVLLTFSTICLIAAILYVAWTFFGRWQTKRRLQQEIHDRELQDARKVVEQYASGHLRILAFYANPPSLTRGEHARIRRWPDAYCSTTLRASCSSRS